ncbi:hypothetical protein EES42_42600 [Streptomyces sp. ADI95-17]|nr:hypothetical protein EES42_42600 [Streptomyces sp. ADI95-17]
MPRSRVSSCRFTAARTFARRARSSWPVVRVSSSPSSRSAALWKTAVRGSSAGTVVSSAASAFRSPASQAARVTLLPLAPSSVARACAPGASWPRLLTSSRCSQPWSASQRATWAPSAPVPPVISTVPRGGVHAVAVGSAASGPGRSGASPGRCGACASRRACRPVARTASWSSPSAATSTRRRRRADRWSSSAGRSTRPPQSWACSALMTPPSPQSRACVGSVTGSVRPTEAAPRVAIHSGALWSDF